MNIFNLKPLAKKVTFDKDNMSVETTDGRKLTVPLAFFPRLLDATVRQRSNVLISGGGAGLHWDDLDEDISVAALFQGIADQTQKNNDKYLLPTKRLKAA